MKWKRMLFTIVLNIFLMLLLSIFLEYSNLTERFVALEDTVQEALDLSISASVHSEEFFTAKYQSSMADKLFSYAGVESGSNDISTEATTLIWLENSEHFAQVNTYQFAKWFESTGYLPKNDGDVSQINQIGISNHFGVVGEMFDWLYGGVGSSYNDPGLQYANKNSAKKAEYNAEAAHISGNNRQTANTNFRAYYNAVGQYQHTAGYLKERTDTYSYKLVLQEYPTLENMGLSWMGGRTEPTSNTTADNLCSSVHIGKSRSAALRTYYFLTPSSLGVTYIPVEVLKPVFVANLDTITRLNKLGASSKEATSSNATEILASASDCLPTDVYDFNPYHDMYETTVTADEDPMERGHVVHSASTHDENIVTDGLVEFDLSTAQVKVDYFFVDFQSDDPDGVIISKLNGTLTPATETGGVTTEDALRQATLDAFLNQDSADFVSMFRGTSYTNVYGNVGDGRIIARVSAKVKVHVPYQSSLLQWASYMFTGSHHYDIKRFDPTNRSAITDYVDGDGIWYQYTTYFCISRS